MIVLRTTAVSTGCVINLVLSIGEAEMADFVIEPKAGGRWYEVGVDGTECDTGLVSEYEPPNRLVLTWHLDGNLQYDPDPAHASEVEVRFHRRRRSAHHGRAGTSRVRSARR